MRRHTLTMGSIAMAAAFALGVLPAVAQESRPSSEGSRPAGGADRTGSAVPRGGDSGGPSGGSVGSGGGTSSGGGSGMSGGSSMGSSSIPSAPSSSGGSVSAPERSQSRSPSRRGGGGESTGGRAVPRNGGGGDNGSPVGVGRTAAASGADGDAPQRRAVPAYSRPRGDRPATGTAVERSTVPGGPVVPIYPSYPYYPYYPYYPWGYWGLGFGYGLGYGYGYYDPYGYGGYYGGGGGGGGGYSQAYRDTGSLRLKIKPRDAQVFVDGYFVGTIDSFDGTFQRLTIDGGSHRIELKADGFEPLEFEVLITPGETVTYKGEMKRIQ